MDPIAAALLDARDRTHALVLDLDDHQWMGPRLPIVNPMRWEIGHIAWFQEKWMLRHARGRPPLRAEGDALYDSAKVAHDTRWDLPLPGREATLAYMREVLDRALEAWRDGRDPYFSELSLYHEDMHGEALAYTRQTLGYPEPALSPALAPHLDVLAPHPAAQSARECLPPQGGGRLCEGPWPGDVEVPGGVFMLGARRDAPHFVFDNEKWAHPVRVETFRIARAPVTNEEYARFVEDRGYERDELWSEAGRRWLVDVRARAPVYWLREENDWRARHYEGTAPLLPYRPVIHVSWYEAEAYCRWAGRRLPTEAEWELAATSHEGGGSRRFPWGDEAPDERRANLDARAGGPLDVAACPDGDSPHGCRQMMGNVWEWTSTRFAPYPWFVVDPYAEYSAPWFESPHMVLRGGCWATRGRLLRNTWRNFYPPGRCDVFAGFRTCAT